MYRVSLRAARANAGMTQRDAPKSLNVSNSTILSWEKGKTSPRIDQLRKLCDTYGVPMDLIFLPEKCTLSAQSGSNNAAAI